MKPVSDAELEVLKALYVEHDTAVDAFVRDWSRLVSLVRDFNRRVGRHFSPEEVLHIMMNERKQGRWPRIRRKYHGRDVKKAS